MYRAYAQAHSTSRGVLYITPAPTLARDPLCNKSPRLFTLWRPVGGARGQLRLITMVLKENLPDEDDESSFGCLTSRVAVSGCCDGCQVTINRVSGEERLAGRTPHTDGRPG
ncbi:hypothetical protein J6590_010573 [Homalodisca vitripennis]|nr:hypothetical protein J6590_010573 [Homalodisca vitripennis]